MFNTIIWCTDGTPNADRALPYAKSLAERDGAKLIIVHVAERYATHDGLPVHPDEELVAAKLQALESELSGRGFDVSLKIVNHVGPQPAHSIGELARDAGADLIVAGSRGHEAIVGLLLGSVAQRLLHVAPCPVLVVPAAAVPAPETLEADAVEAARN